MKLGNECLRVNAHHPHCPEAEDDSPQTFTIWQAGKTSDLRVETESEMRQASRILGFDAKVVISEGEADIVKDGIVLGGCYVNEESVYE